MRIDLAQLEFIDRKLRILATSIEKHFGVEFTIVSLYRIDDKGVHGQLPVRGLDWSCKDTLLGEAVAKYINTWWAYDSDRPEMKCCIFHNAGEGYHLHLQTCNNTKRR